jgi:RNA polymerase sigma-70 factor, ECF subfamily
LAITSPAAGVWQGCVKNIYLPVPATVHCHTAYTYVQKGESVLKVLSLTDFYRPLFFRKKKFDFAADDFESLIRGCRAGNEQAQQALFKQYFGYAKSICLRHCSSHEEAEEVLNEGFLKVFQNLEKYDTTQPFKAWLRTILINTAISHYRKNARYTRDTVALEEAIYPSFDDNVIEKITAEEILTLVQQLKPIYRTVFMLYVVEGYNHREIADLLDVNEATVRSHYARARMQLQHLIKRSFPDLFPNDWGVKTYKHNEN